MKKIKSNNKIINIEQDEVKIYEEPTMNTVQNVETSYRKQAESINFESTEKTNNEYSWSKPIETKEEIQTQYLPKFIDETQNKTQNQNAKIKPWQEVDINSSNGEVIEESLLDKKTRDIIRQVNEYIENQKNNKI